MLFDLFKAIEILYDLCKKIKSTILNCFVFMDIFIIKRNKDTGYFLAIKLVCRLWPKGNYSQDLIFP